jgi:hypothetical protein
MNSKSLILALLFLPAGCWAHSDDPITDTTTIHDIMHHHVMPSAQVLWDATAVYITIKGEDDRYPKNDAEWDAVEQSRIALEQALQALLVPGRVADIPEAGEVIPEGDLKPDEIQALIKSQPEVWAAMIHALDGTLQQAKIAIAEHDVEALREIGGAIDENCEACHKIFWYPKH